MPAGYSAVSRHITDALLRITHSNIRVFKDVTCSNELTHVLADTREATLLTAPSRLSLPRAGARLLGWSGSGCLAA
jgi:hypothetical protein